MQGIYRDQVWTREGRLILDRGWRSNTITTTAWPLVAGLLRNDPALGGILYVAVGSGDPQWDSGPATSDASLTTLHDELVRQPVPIKDISYLDADGSPTQTPTSCIEITTRFSWSDQTRTLRELGLFGGDATAGKDSGYLINHLIHPRIDLGSETTLERTLRLTLTPQVPVGWLETPEHWLGDLQINKLEGVGMAIANKLKRVRILTIADMARHDLHGQQSEAVSIPLTTQAQLRATARLLLRTAAGLIPVAGLDGYTAGEVVLTAASTLAADTGVDLDQIHCLQEQIGVLRLTMDRDLLDGTRVVELLGTSRSAGAE
jgi:hypothetical protein